MLLPITFDVSRFFMTGFPLSYYRLSNLSLSYFALPVTSPFRISSDRI